MNIPPAGFEAIVEQRIREAQERGDLDDLPGAGAPLELDDDALIPEELRVAYRVLKNAGYVPPEVDALKDIRALEQALDRAHAPAERERIRARLQALTLRSPLGRRFGNLRAADDYFEKIADKLARPRDE